MLIELSIQNLALIEKLQLNFHQGFSCLTGETGAGKSILLDALGLTLGERADTGLVRHGTPRADVTATFDLQKLPSIQNWLVENELETDDRSCLLRRTVNAKSGSKAYINGIPVPAALLKQLGNQLIDIHGQHEHQSLLSNQKQLALLDAFAAHPKLTDKTLMQFKSWQTLEKELQTLQSKQQEHQGRLELLQFQHQEFSSLNPQEGEFEQLSEKQQTLSHANEIMNSAMTAFSHLEDEAGASMHIQSAITAIESVVDVMPGFKPLLHQLNSALIDIQETAAELQTQANHIDLDPQELDTAEYRLSEIFSLAKKYQLEPSCLAQKLTEIENELDQLENPTQSLETLQAQIQTAQQQFHTTARALSASRKSAAKKLSKAITQGMQNLGMPNGEFQIKFSEKSQPAGDGIDRLEFMVSANKGLPLQPLSKVASGGELSRISLAIQVATAEVAQLPTLIFDEVDVGIGGAVAEMVGKKLQTLGEHKQILSITHLPQVASHGHQHLQIQKFTRKNLTYTEVKTLEPNSRVEEIARMLGGMKLTENTLQHANEMLEQAQA